MVKSIRSIMFVSPKGSHTPSQEIVYWLSAFLPDVKNIGQFCFSDVD